MSRRRMRLVLCGFGVACVLSLSVGGCQPYERVVRYNPPLANLPEAETGEDVTGRGPRRQRPDPLRQEPEELRVEDEEEGEERLVSRSPRHVLRHVRDTLRDGDAELFADQVLSEITRREFHERGLDPTEAFDLLKEREDDVMELFSRMPMGEQTPGILMQRVGSGVYRLEVSGPGVRDMRFRYMDVVSESGQWRLRWFGP